VRRRAQPLTLGELGYLEWGTAIALDVSQSGVDVSSDDPVPLWDRGPAA
jgi:hypothetical protein